MFQVISSTSEVAAIVKRAGCAEETACEDYGNRTDVTDKLHLYRTTNHLSFSFTN